MLIKNVSPVILINDNIFFSDIKDKNALIESICQSYLTSPSACVYINGKYK